MLFILRSGSNPSQLIEKIKARSASHKILDLYGRRIVVAWPDKLIEDISDSSVEAKVKPLSRISWHPMTGKRIRPS